MKSNANNWMRAAVALAVAGAAGTSAAVDFGGYFRAGPGATSNNLSRACYGLAGPGLKYRLGNECDIYGEFIFSQPFTKDGVEYRASFMPSIYNGATDTGGSELKVAQMFASAKGFDVLPEATFWIGKRFYGRADVHIVDTFFVKMDGVGGGVDGIQAGPGKLGVAYFREDGDGKLGANRFNVDYGDIAVNPGGKLRFVGNWVDPTFSGGDSGQALTVQHNQEGFPFIGAKNVAWLQAAGAAPGWTATSATSWPTHPTKRGARWKASTGSAVPGVARRWRCGSRTDRPAAARRWAPRWAAACPTRSPRTSSCSPKPAIQPGTRAQGRSRS